jgi:hypothetical protein
MLVSTMTAPAVQDLIDKSFTTGLKKESGAVRKVFHPETESWKHNKSRIQEIDRERLAERKLEGQASAQRGMAQGYYKEIARSTISITRKTSGEMYKALEAHKLAENVTAVAEDIVDKIELDMRNFLGFGTSASYTDNGGYTIDTTVGDGLSLFNATHTLKFSSTTYSNILAGNPTFSEDAMDEAEDYFSYNVMDNYGKRLTMKPNTIITADKAIMRNRVARLLKSIAPESIEGTANSNSGVVNTYKDKFQHLVIEFDVDALDVTDSSKSFYWFLATLGGSPRKSFQAYYVKWQSPMVAPAEVNQDTWVLSYTARSAYGIGAVSGKGILIVKATS